MKIKLLIIACFCCLAQLSLQAQSLHLGFLFNSGITYSSELHAPASINDSVDYGFDKHRLQFILPLKTKVGVNLKDFNFKKMDARASQLFLTAGVGFNRVNFNGVAEDPIYKGFFGVTGINAGFRSGIWLYSATVYINESEKTFDGEIIPNFRGYLARVKVKSFDFIYFYGAGIVVNQGRIIPIPIFGGQKKLAEKLKAVVIFPVEAKLNYSFSNRFNLDIGANYDAVNTIYREGGINNNDRTINYMQLKPFIAGNAKIGSDIKLKLEAGWSSLQRYSDFDNFSQNVGSTPFAAITINYQIGNSLFGQVLRPQE